MRFKPILWLRFQTLSLTTNAKKEYANPYATKIILWIRLYLEVCIQLREDRMRVLSSETHFHSFVFSIPNANDLLMQVLSVNSTHCEWSLTFAS